MHLSFPRERNQVPIFIAELSGMSADRNEPQITITEMSAIGKMSIDERLLQNIQSVSYMNLTSHLTHNQMK